MDKPAILLYITPKHRRYGVANPMKNSHPPIELLLNDEVQKLLDSFAELFELRVSFFSLDETMIRRGSQMKNADYCEIVQNELGKLDCCLALDREMRQQTADGKQLVHYRCHAGLREAIAPVMVHGQLAGFLMIGQFRLGDELPGYLSDPAVPAATRQKLHAAFDRLPRLSEQKINHVLLLFKMLIDYISDRELAILQNDQLKEDIDCYIAKHFAEDIRLPEMARKLGKSVSTVSQFLRKNYNTNFKDLLIDYRLNRAEEFWQRHPSATVSEAAFEAGFKDQFYFSRVFRRRKGMTPGEFRAQWTKTS